MKLAKTLMLTLALISASAFALTSPSQIATMMDNGNLTGAEAAIKEVLTVKDTAKVHYMLAQVYLKEGKRPDAQAELDRANMMDPEHSYTDNQHYRPVADAIAGRVVPAVTAAPVIVPHNAPLPMTPASPPDYTLLWIFLILFGIAGAGWVGYLAYSNVREKRRKLLEVDQALATLRTKSATLVSAVEKALLNEKTAESPSVAKLGAIQAVQVKALNLYERAKNLITDDFAEVNNMISECGNIRSSLSSVVNRNYETPTPKAKVIDPGLHYEAPVPKTRSPARVRTVAQPAAPVAPPPVVQSTPQAVRETVIVNNSNPVADVLMVDLMLNESRREDERRRERDAEDRRERLREDSRRAERDREEERERQSSYSSRSSSTDSGNSDSWSSSSSSSDSGSSDSWSSSSSSSSDSGSSSSSWD